MNNRILTVVFGLVCCLLAGAQSSSDSIAGYRPIKQSNSINQAASKLSKSLQNEEKDEQIAADYESLARELFAKEEYIKAEEYLKKSKTIYQKNKNRQKAAAACRELAKVQEAMHSYKDAIASYEDAAGMETDESRKQINMNDAKRLRHVSDPVAQSSFIQENIDLLDKQGSKEEQSKAYQQMAEANLQLNQNKDAIVNLNRAISNTTEKSEEILNIKRKIANVYMLDQQPEKAIQMLQEVYRAALENGNTSEAKKSVKLLAEEYLRLGDEKQSIRYYQDFLDRFDQLIKSDSSLVDAKLFQVTEQKISQMEEEKRLKDELLDKKSTLNNVFIILIIVLLLSVLLVHRAYSTIKTKNKKIALQSLRREMNPHFIFNSLNSVNHFIAQSNEIEANKYLTSYSRLMRNVMENSNKDFIRLDKEIELLKEYLDLEYLRFSDKFTYEMDVDRNLDAESVYIPNMLIQPNLENAIWHGLRYKETPGFLRLSISGGDREVIVRIEDDGIGLAESNQIKTHNQKIHDSRGLTNIRERIRLLNELYKKDIYFRIDDRNDSSSGVVVIIRFPINGIKN